MNNMYNIIEELCIKKKIKIGQMCKETGISRGSLGDLKAGRINELSLKTTNKIADYFNVSVDYLLGNTNEKNPPAGPEDDITFDKFTYAMHNESKELTEAQKQMLLEMARMFKKELDKEGK